MCDCSKEVPPCLVLRQDARGSLRELCMNRDAQSALVDFEGYVSEKDCVTIFKALANLSHLQCLHISSSILPVAALTAIISHPSSPIIHLQLDNVTLSAKTLADYMTLVESFRLCSLRSIECIELAYCDFADQSMTIEPFLRALSTIPTLEQVSLIGTTVLANHSNSKNHALSSWNCQSLLQLLPQLRSLRLEKMPDLQHEQFCMLAQALESRFCTLRGLTLQNFQKKRSMSHDSIFRLAEMLQVNTHLHELTIQVYCVDHVLWIVQALQNNPNTNLKRLTFVGSWGLDKQGYDSALRQELLEMVKTHVKLEKLELGDDKHELSTEMATYIDMNRISQRCGDICLHSSSSFGSTGIGLVTTVVATAAATTTTTAPTTSQAQAKRVRT